MLSSCFKMLEWDSDLAKQSVLSNQTGPSMKVIINSASLCFVVYLVKHQGNTGILDLTLVQTYCEPVFLVEHKILERIQSWEQTRNWKFILGQLSGGKLAMGQNRYDSRCGDNHRLSANCLFWNNKICNVKIIWLWLYNDDSVSCKSCSLFKPWLCQFFCWVNVVI